MSLLSVTVKRAKYHGPQANQLSTYVTLKLQHVKSTTVTVKGAEPCWEQDFLFETEQMDTGLLVEVWSKGLLWDKALGYRWLPLTDIQYSNEEGQGQWLALHLEPVVNASGEVVGTRNPTGDDVLLDCRFEVPFAGVSEDSDYTSDIGYPIGQNPNSSASQYLGAASIWPARTS
ncbi:protein unc-13 homolog A-like [Amphibalanus amphitrite]|uniref:protein unc-13 homolog A-like n=1 Tax=Amphibalanus amphitrite TaxID=1232801 RepID=UPI001C923691|nr:protein unc-13 homolog A-like [Amphibalanus amphitrite]